MTETENSATTCSLWQKLAYILHRCTFELMDTIESVQLF